MGGEGEIRLSGAGRAVTKGLQNFLTGSLEELYLDCAVHNGLRSCLKQEAYSLHALRSLNDYGLYSYLFRRCEQFPHLTSLSIEDSLFIYTHGGIVPKYPVSQLSQLRVLRVQGMDVQQITALGMDAHFRNLHETSLA